MITRNVITSLVEPGYFSLLLQDVLTELGNNVNPLYFTYHYTDSAIGDYYITEVHINEDQFGARLYYASLYIRRLHQQRRQESLVVSLPHPPPGAAHHRVPPCSSPS